MPVTTDWFEGVGGVYVCLEMKQAGRQKKTQLEV